MSPSAWRGAAIAGAVRCAVPQRDAHATAHGNPVGQQKSTKSVCAHLLVQHQLPPPLLLPPLLGLRRVLRGGNARRQASGRSVLRHGMRAPLLQNRAALPGWYNTVAGRLLPPGPPPHRCRPPPPPPAAPAARLQWAGGKSRRQRVRRQHAGKQHQGSGRRRAATLLLPADKQPAAPASQAAIHAAQRSKGTAGSVRSRPAGPPASSSTRKSSFSNSSCTPTQRINTPVE